MPHSVLILEDEALIAWDIEEELQSRGWQVLATAASIAAAREALQGRRPDVALLDVNLGSETSFDLARQCRAEGIAVVFLTGECGHARPQDLRDVPICAKPVAYDRLAMTLSGVVRDKGRDSVG